MNESRPVLVIGAAGQLGSVITRHLQADHHRGSSIIPLTRRDLDVSDVYAVEDTIAGIAPGLVVNCAAYNDVDGAEQDAAAALAVNAFAVAAMARASARVDAILVHYSSDFVFDGETASPYSEVDRARPLSVYGASKLLGEWFAAAVPLHYILRVSSLFGGAQGRTSIDRIITALEAGHEAHVFADRTVSPSFVDDVAEATVMLVSNGAAAGVYHCVNSGFASWYDVGRFLAQELHQDERLLKRISVHDVRLPAARPVFCALSNAKLARAGVPMPRWEQAVRRYLTRQKVRRPAADGKGAP